MKTIRPNQTFEFIVKAYEGKIVGPEAELANKDFLLKPVFITLDHPNKLESVVVVRLEK